MNEVIESRSAAIQRKRRKRRKKLIHKMLKILVTIICLCLGTLFIYYSLNEEGLFNSIIDFNITKDDKPGDSNPSASHTQEQEIEEDSADEQEVSGEVSIEMESEQLDQRVRLALVGDVLLGSTVQNLLDANGYDYPYIHVRDRLRQADLAIANLETPITTGGEPAEKQYVYRSKPEALPALQDAGFRIVNLANNHILDYGQEGLIDTLKFLDEAGMYYVGAGMNDEEAYRAVFIEHDGIRIAVLGFSQVVPEVNWKATKYQPGVADMYALEPPVAAIEQAASTADLVIVIAHWGREREEVPNERQIAAAHAFIEAGADLIIGSHPHVLQGFEMYKGKWIAYSLGNFIFTTNDYAPTWESIILEAECDSSGDCALEVVPVWVKWAQPIEMDEEDSNRLYKRLEEISQSLSDIYIDENGRISIDSTHR